MFASSCFCFLFFVTPGSCVGSPKGVAGGGTIELVSKTGSITIGNDLFQNSALINKG